MTETQNKLMKVIQELLSFKDDRTKNKELQTKHFGLYKKHLGKVQELTRKINKKIDDLEEFRTKK